MFVKRGVYMSEVKNLTDGLKQWIDRPASKVIVGAALTTLFLGLSVTLFTTHALHHHAALTHAFLLTGGSLFILYALLKGLEAHLIARGGSWSDPNCYHNRFRFPEYAGKWVDRKGDLASLKGIAFFRPGCERDESPWGVSVKEKNLSEEEESKMQQLGEVTNTIQTVYQSTWWPWLRSEELLFAVKFQKQPVAEGNAT